MSDAAPMPEWFNRCWRGCPQCGVLIPKFHPAITHGLPLDHDQEYGFCPFCDSGLVDADQALGFTNMERFQHDSP